MSATMDGQGLKFLWAELTNTCNESCQHCYNDSGPHRGRERLVSVDSWKGAISSAARLGCRSIQFIGGEPMTDPALSDLICHARKEQFSFVEVSTNATLLTPKLLDCFVENQVSVAVSLYSHSAEEHESITGLRGSHAKTVAALETMRRAGLDVRVNVVSVLQDASEIEVTRQFVESLGIKKIGVDRVRGFGRGEQFVELGVRGKESELCGHCWDGRACILPNGDVVPCIMSRDARLGSILQVGLEEIVDSARAEAVRKGIFERVWLPKVENTLEQPCSPHSCSPLNCSPTNCSPNNCSPW